MSAPPEESNPLSRQRVSRACDLCRRKKVKCDGATPVCTNCKSVGLECTFKDMTKKRGPPKGYIEAIENRLYKLENFLADLAKGGDIQSKQLLSELNSPLETPTGEQIRVRPVRRAPKSERNKVFFWQQDQAGKRKRESLTEGHHSTISDDDDDDDDDEDKKPDQTPREESVDGGVGQLTMDENGQVRYLGKSSGYYLLQNSRTYQNGAFHFANYGNRPRNHKHDNQSTDVNPLELPPKDLSEHLLRLYFKHFYPFLPLFYKRQLFSTVDNPTVDPVAPLLLNAIYAVASRISPDVRVRSDPNSPDTAGDLFFDRAEKLLDESYDTPRISTVQALLLLASHQHGAMKSARAWLYSGMAFRMAQDLGLHRNCDHWNIPPEEGERRKRVFWCCYIVDRLASAMYGRASTFEERDCDVPFPSIDDDNPYYDDGPNATPTSSPPVRLLQTFINLIKICDILGHVLKNIYYVRSLQYTGTRPADTVLTTWNKKLHQWYDQLPDCLQVSSKKDGKLPSTAVCQLHMIYHTTVILLHRPFIPGPNQSLIPSLLPCASICSAAADAVLSITNSMLSENKLRFVMNYSVYYIFTSALIFTKTACINKAEAPPTADYNKSLEAKVKVTKCMQALDEIEATWTTASKNCQILAELSGFRDMDIQANQWHQPIHQPIEKTSSSTYLSPQPSRNPSPQLQPNDGHRVNSSNLRFPIRRVDSESNQQENDNTNRTLYTPNSTSNMDFAMANPFQNDTQINNTATAMDPFAAPGIIPVPSPRQYDPLGTAFWGVPSSLDANEWNNFMNSNSNHLSPTPQPQQQQGTSSFSHSLHDRLYESPNTHGEIYHHLHHQQDKKLIHTDQNVDILSGVSMPMEQQPSTTSSSPSNATLMSYLPQLHQQRSSFNQHTTTTSNSIANTSTVHNNNDNSIPTSIPMNGRPSSSTNSGALPPRGTHGGSGDLANAYYW